MDKKEQEVKKIFDSFTSKKILMALGGVVIALLIFQAGVFVGFHKAAFSYQMGANYYNTFGAEHRGGLFPGMSREEFSGGEGSIGKILNITLPNIVIEGRDNVEKVLTLTDDTIIKRLRDDVGPESLSPGDVIVVIGSPNESGQIEAKFIRLLPVPPPNMPFPANPTTSPLIK